MDHHMAYMICLQSFQLSLLDVYPSYIDVEWKGNLIKQEMIAELHAALDELEEMDRTIMKMFGDGATEKQIAEVVHLSQKGVNKRKKKVMVQLKTTIIVMIQRTGLLQKNMKNSSRMYRSS